MVRPIREWNYRQKSPQDQQRLLRVLQQIIYIADTHRQASTIGWGDKGDHFWEPFVMPWDYEEYGDVHSETVLDALQSHRDLRRAVRDRDEVVHLVVISTMIRTHVWIETDGEPSKPF